MSADIARFVEQTGLALEAEGMPRMAGRILGYLMVCTPSEQSIASLMKALQASNGSISTMTRLLESQGYLERIPVQGERRDYFALPPSVGVTMLTAAQKSMENVRQLFDRALELNRADGKNRGARPSLQEGRDLFDFLAQEFPLLLARWEQQRQRQKSRGVRSRDKRQG